MPTWTFGFNAAERIDNQPPTAGTWSSAANALLQDGQNANCSWPVEPYSTTDSLRLTGIVGGYPGDWNPYATIQAVRIYAICHYPFDPIVDPSVPKLRGVLYLSGAQVPTLLPPPVVPYTEQAVKIGEYGAGRNAPEFDLVTFAVEIFLSDSTLGDGGAGTATRVDYVFVEVDYEVVPEPEPPNPGSIDPVPFHFLPGEAVKLPRITAGSTGGPTYDTQITRVSSGYEHSHAYQGDERGGRWEVHMDVLDEDLKDEVLAFFICRGGAHRAFLFSDPFDYEAKGQEPEFVSGTTYQLVKLYPDAENPRARRIRHPRCGSVALYDGGEPIDEDDFDVDLMTGEVTLANAPSGTLTADFQFYVAVRFESDALQMEADGPVYASGSLTLVEVRD